VSQESAEDFCKHAHGIVRVTTRSVEQEVARPQEAAVEAVREALEDDLYQDPVQVREFTAGYFLSPISSCWKATHSMELAYGSGLRVPNWDWLQR
jgi:hypothetical protein